MDGKLWIECDGCRKWNHTDCEINKGTDKNMKDVAMDLNQQVALESSRPPNEIHEEQHEEKPYWCIKCLRAKNAELKKERSEQLKQQKPKPSQPVQERVSTRQLARASKRKSSEELELESLEESKNGD